VSLVFFVAFLLAQFGLAYIVGHSEISLPWRTLLARSQYGERLVKFVECPACFGFWAGAAFWEMGLPDAQPHVAVFRFFFWGCVVSGSNFLLGRLSRLI